MKYLGIDDVSESIDKNVYLSFLVAFLRSSFWRGSVA